jgi:hypothetical protein
MSKKAKAKQKEKRLQKKRAIKNANKDRYAEMKRLGQNSKSKRATKQGKKGKRVKTVDHPNGACGNIGCKKCDPCGIHKRAA